TRFDRLHHIMPECNRLIKLLFYKAPLRSLKGISAIKDLISLIKNNYKVIY
ncbi:hypothetical protein QBC46DRAFT_268589, partial [Diplogelasinospora grovesii]